jgi:hypothetical protein
VNDRSDGFACPPWCRRVHVGTPTRLAHGVTLTDAQLGDLNVAVVVVHHERLDRASGIGPHARIDITGQGNDAAGIDLTPSEVTMLARALCVDGGAEVMAHALRAASAALHDEAAGNATAPVFHTKAQAHDDGSQRR